VPLLFVVGVIVLAFFLVFNVASPIGYSSPHFSNISDICMSCLNGSATKECGDVIMRNLTECGKSVNYCREECNITIVL
jgi:hypothetical protein